MTKLEQLINKLCPEGVEYCELGEICSLVTGATPSKVKNDYWENGTISWMSSGEVNNKIIYDTEQKITQLGYNSASTTLVPVHSIVIALAGQGKTRGKVAMTEIELCTNQSLCSMICGERIFYKFLYYYLDSKYLELREISNGDGARGGLSLKILSPYKVPVPPIEVQYEIVRILDNFTEVTVELAEKLTAELTARKKQYEHYRDHLLSAHNSKVKSLDELCFISAGGDAPKEAISKEKNDEFYIPIISNGIGENAFYGYTNIAKITTPAVTVAARGTIGYAEYRDYPYYPIIRLLSVIPKDTLQLNTKYLYYCLQGKQYNVPMGGIPQLTAPELKKVEIAVPPIEVQERLVRVLDNFEAICADLKIGLPAEIEARKKQYEFYRDALLTFAETGDCSQFVNVEREREREREREQTKH